MKSSEDIKPISYMKTHSAALIEEAQKSPIIITQNGEARAVLQDMESYNRQKKALFMLRLIALGEKDISSGRYRSQAEVLAHFDKVTES